MRIKFFKDGNRYRFWNYLVPAGKFEGTIEDGVGIGIYDIVTNKEVLPITRFDQFIKADGSTYASFDELLAAVGDFFVDASGDGGLIQSDHRFADAPARDSYFNPDNLFELFPGLEIIVGTEIQKWTGPENPSTSEYTTLAPTNWVNISGNTLTGEQIVTLVEAVPNTNFLTDAEQTILSYFTDTADELQLSKALFTPSIRTDSSSAVIGSITISSNTESAEVQDNVSEQRAILLQTKYNPSGSSTPITPVLGTSGSVTVSDLEDEDLTGTLGFSYTITTTRHSHSIIIKPASAGTLNLIVRADDSTGQELFRIRDFTITADDIGKETAIPASDGGQAIVSQGDIVFISASGISFKGHTYSNDPDFGDQAIPFLKVGNHPYSEQNLATEEYVQNLIGNQLELTGFSIDIPARVDISTDLNVQKTISYTVSGYSEITSLELQINGSNVATLTVPTSDGTQTEQITLSGIDTGGETTLRFRLQANNMDNSNTQIVQVRNLPQAETLYYGVSNTNNASTIDEGTLTTVEILPGTIFNADFDTPSNHWDIILVPSDRSISIEERTFSTDITTDFTKTNNIRSIGGQSYDAYVHQNGSGVQGILSTTITVS